MAGLNKVTIIGHLGADPESKRLNNGNTVVNLRVATSESWRDKQSGERRESVEWHSVVIWNEGLAKVAEQYLEKGSKVYIEGKLKTRSWDDQQSGQKRYTTEIVLEQFRGELLMLDGKNDREGGGGRGNGNGGGARDGGSGRRDEREERGRDYGRESGGGSRGSRTASRDMDDEIPFQMEWRG